MSQHFQMFPCLVLREAARRLVVSQSPRLALVRRSLSRQLQAVNSTPFRALTSLQTATRHPSSNVSRS